MLKLSPSVSTLVPKIARAVAGSCPSENRFARSASHAVVPLIRSSPLAHPCKPIQLDQYTKPLLAAGARSLGAIRAYSSDLPPPKRLVDCYQTVLEDAVLNQRDIIEMVDYDNFCIVTYVTKTLDLSPGESPNLLGNGYSITGIRETWPSGNTPARMYELQVQPPEVAGKVRQPFVLPITVFKAEVLRDLNPDNLRAIFAACSIAVKVHSGKLRRSLYDSIKVFSSSFADLGKLYLCAESVRAMISNRHVSTPKELFAAIKSHLGDGAIEMKSPFLPALRLILLEEFRKKYSVQGLEVPRSPINETPRKSEPELFRHEIGHKGGAYRAAMKLNAFAKGSTGEEVSAVCVTHSAEQGEQVFSIAYDPRGVWFEKRINPQTGEIEGFGFATPDQLSAALKQRGVKAIISRSLGML